MDSELKEVINILRKVFPVLLENPKIMTGCDISEEEIDNIINTEKISLEVLQHVAGDRFFQNFYDELNINKNEAIEAAEFLSKTAIYYFKELKKEFPYLEE